MFRPESGSDHLAGWGIWEFIEAGGDPPAEEPVLWADGPEADDMVDGGCP